MHLFLIDKLGGFVERKANGLFSEGVELGEIIEELCQRHPLSGVGPLAWLEASTEVAYQAGLPLAAVLGHWSALSHSSKLTVSFDVDIGLVVEAPSL